MPQSVDPAATRAGARDQALGADRLFRCPSQQQVLGEVMHALSQEAGICVLTGEAGLGKTVLVQRELARWPGTVRVVTARGPNALAALKAMEHVGGAGVLVFEDAHEMPATLLRQLGAWPALTFHILLLGRPDLWTRLRDPALHRLADRVRQRCVLFPLPYDETEQYLSHLFTLAGGWPEQVLSQRDRQAMLQSARGNPRHLNALLAMRLGSERGPGHARRQSISGSRLLRLLAGVVSVMIMVGGIIGVAAPELVSADAWPARRPQVASRPSLAAAPALGPGRDRAQH